MLLRNQLKILFALVFLLLLKINGEAQTYGLYFSGPEVTKDLRTGLNLSEYKSIPFNSDFSISFDLMFRSFENRHFGFISRYIFDGKTNLDFIYDNRDGENKLLVVVNDNIHEIYIPTLELKNQWIPVKFDFYKKEDNLMVLVQKQSLSIKNIGLEKATKAELFFGAVPGGIFTTSDVPAMNLKNIEITHEDKRLHKWLLSETTGTMVNDLNSQINGKAYNPVWLTQKHSNWHEIKTLDIAGKTGVTFNKKNNELIFVCSDRIIRLNPENADTVEQHYQNRLLLNLPSPGSVFANDSSGIVHVFYPSENTALTFNQQTKKWNGTNANDPRSNFFHFNKYYSESDSCLLVFGGLLNSGYESTFKKYDFSLNRWTELLLKGDTISPRYLSAFGSNDNGNTFYVLGGYGSNSGDPVQNAHYFNDLYSIDLKSLQSRKIATYGITNQDFSFANSMIFAPSNEDFYVLSFSSHKYNSELQLLKGNLQQEGFTEVGNTIPYIFQEKKSYADLYFSEKLNQLVAVTIFNDENNISHIKVYSIYSPPNKSQLIIQDEIDKRKAWYWVVLILSFDVVLFLGFLISKKIKDKTEARIKAREAEKKKELERVLREQSEGEKPRSSIFLFGGFQVFDSNGKDISKLFTPLLKELFLIILLYPFKNGKGISSDKLTETFWFDKQPQKASNNKAVNIGKLRKIIDMVGSNHVSNKNGYYSLTFNTGTPKVYIDVLEFRDIVQQDEINKDDLLRLLKIMQKGTILSFLNNEWLDDIKERISSQIIDVLIDQLQLYSASSDLNLVLKIADSILIFDPLNENAISEKCRVLINLGNHGLAQKTFSKFVTDYEKLYDTTYDKTLKDIIE